MFIILFSFIFRFQRRRRTSGWSEKEVTVAAKQKAEVEEDLKMAAEVATAKHELDRLTLIHAEAKSLLDLTRSMERLREERRRQVWRHM